MSLRNVPMVDARCWRFDHDGNRYTLLMWNGTDSVHLFHTQSGVHMGSRETRGFDPERIAEEIHEEITSPLRKA